MLFADLLSLHLLTFVMFIFLFMSLYFSSTCMLELKFAIYYRAASLPSQASYAVLAEKSQAFFKHSLHTNSISNSAILRNNYISLLSDLCTCVHVKKKWHHKGSHSSSVSASSKWYGGGWCSTDFILHCTNTLIDYTIFVRRKRTCR